MKKAFTLVELLAVIVILLSLAALIYPVIATSKDVAKKAICASNLHEIGLATAAYQSDFDDHYPVVVNYLERADPLLRLGRSPNDDPSAYQTPRSALQRYAGNAAGVFRCARDTGGNVAVLKLYPTVAEFNDNNSYLFAELFDGQTASTWKDPSKATWACDAGSSWHAPNYDPLDINTYMVMSLAYDGHVALKHSWGPTFLE